MKISCTFSKRGQRFRSPTLQRHLLLPGVFALSLSAKKSPKVCPLLSRSQLLGQGGCRAHSCPGLLRLPAPWGTRGHGAPSAGRGKVLSPVRGDTLSGSAAPIPGAGRGPGASLGSAGPPSSPLPTPLPLSPVSLAFPTARLNRRKESTCRAAGRALKHTHGAWSEARPTGTSKGRKTRAEFLNHIRM